MSPIVAHLDLDAFFAAVEELESPELRGRPLVVGGDPHGRGVVATANYVARRFGIVSAMSCAEALRRCPTAVFVRPRMAVYREYSREVWTIVREIVPTVEQAGIDEGYLDLGEVAPGVRRRACTRRGGAGRRPGAHAALVLARASRRSKLVAKVASDRRKPGGLTVVRPGREAAFLAPFPIRVLPGIGPRAAARLAAAGVETIGDLAALGDAELARAPAGQGRAARPRPCARHRPAAARDLDRADLDLERGDLPRDVGDAERLHDELRRMAVRLAEHLRERRQTARTVTTKLRYPDFAIRTRSTSLDGRDRRRPRASASWRARLLDRALRDRPGPLRLVGVGVSGLADHAQLHCRSPTTSERVRPMEGFSFATAIRVRFAETDAQGVAHNSNYFVWFEVARVEFLERFAGGYQRLRDEGIESLVLESHARFLLPARLRRPAARPHALPGRARRALPLRVRGRARRRHDRRRLDGARDGRRGDAPADQDAGWLGPDQERRPG